MIGLNDLYKLDSLSVKELRVKALELEVPIKNNRGTFLIKSVLLSSIKIKLLSDQIRKQLQEDIGIRK